MNIRTKLLEKSPENLTRWEDLVQTAMMGERYNDASRILQKGILRLNGAASLWNMLGDVFMKQEKESFALHCYKKASAAGNEGARNKADDLINKKVVEKEITLRDTILGEL
jgi:predicted Zn-dependent protease